MKKILILTFALFSLWISTALGAPADNQNSAQYWMAQGAQLQMNNDYRNSIEAYTKALEIDNNLFDAYFLRGAAYGRLSKYELAINDFTKALEIGPDSKKSTYFSSRGSYYFLTNQHQLAIQDLTEAIKLDPESLSSYLYRAASFSELQQYENAITDFTEAIRLRPGTAIFHVKRGDCYSESGQYDLALTDYRTALKCLNSNSNSAKNIQQHIRDVEAKMKKQRLQ